MNAVSAGLSAGAGSIIVTVARACHGAAAAVAAAGRFALLFVFAQPDHDPGHQRNQRDTDDDRSGIFADPLKHILTPSVSVWLLPGTS